LIEDDEELEGGGAEAEVRTATLGAKSKVARESLALTGVPHEGQKRVGVETSVPQAAQVDIFSRYSLPRRVDDTFAFVSPVQPML
jgi:hypothetical protein